MYTNYNGYQVVSKIQSGAAGILPYTIFRNKIYIMLGFERRGYSDFGGYKDSVYEKTTLAAAREFSEETLGLFCKNVESRGTIGGVVESTFIFDKILTNQELHLGGIINKVLNLNNKYEMFICPVDRFISSDEFKYIYECNRNTVQSQKIDCTEKRSIWWFELDTILNAIETDQTDIKCSNNRIYTLYGSFFKTLKESFQFLKNLQSNYQYTQNDTGINLLQNIISNIFASTDLLDGFIPPHETNEASQPPPPISSTHVQPNIQKIQAMFSNNNNNFNK